MSYRLSKLLPKELYFFFQKKIEGYIAVYSFLFGQIFTSHKAIDISIPLESPCNGLLNAYFVLKLNHPNSHKLL